MELGRVFIDDVFIGTRHRSLDSSRVESLAESIKAIGLQTPISVYVDGDDHAHLVAGLHRLEAARHLGWERIDANFVKMDDVERELWEIAENLHRVELTKEQRDEHIRRYAELIERRDLQSTQNAAIESRRADGRGHRPKGTARKVAEEVGVSVDTVRRALAPEQPKPQSKPAAPLNDIETTDKQVARLMSAWNAAGREAREAFLSLIDKPVMDARYGDHDASPFLDRRGTQ